MIFILLLFTLVVLLLGIFSLVLSGRTYRNKARVFSFSIATLCLLGFGYWFSQKSTSFLIQDAVSTQVISKLPQAVDFYVIKIEDHGQYTSYTTNHLGIIRPDHYRMLSLEMQQSEEFWVVGYLGKNLVHFSQFFVPNKNIDQIIKVENYNVENTTNSEIAGREILLQHQENRNLAILSTLITLFLFLLIILLIKKR